jgi:hypothetical protein
LQHEAVPFLSHGHLPGGHARQIYYTLRTPFAFSVCWGGAVLPRLWNGALLLVVLPKKGTRRSERSRILKVSVKVVRWHAVGAFSFQATDTSITKCSADMWETSVVTYMTGGEPEFVIGTQK